MAIEGGDNTPNFYAFEAFDPVDGEPTDFVGGKFKEIAYRARKLLVKRSRQEILAMGDTLCWLLGSELARGQAFELIDLHVKALDEGKGQSDFEHISLNNVAQILRLMEKVSIDDIDDAIPGLTWPELLAVLALGEIDEAIEWEQHYQQKGYPEDDSIYTMTLGPYAVEAMEAVCAAEALQRGNPSIQAKKIVSDQTRKAALKRHQATNNLKREFIHFYHSREFKSRADAARRFYLSLPDKKQRLLTHTNAIRTLTDALSAHLKTV